MERLRSILLTLALLASPLDALAQDSAAYLKAGNQLYQSKDYAKAAQYYQAAVQLDPSSAAAHQGLGNCRYQSGDKSGALAAYEKALALTPGNSALASFVQNLRAQVGAPAPAAEPAFAAQPSFTQDTSSKKTSFEVSIMAGLALSMTEGYGMGFGGGAAGRIPMGQGLSLGAAVGYYAFGNSQTVPGGKVDNSIGNLEILGSVKYAFQGGGGLSPYVLGGAGIALYMNSVTSTYDPPLDIFNSSVSASSMYPMIQAGGGVAFDAGKDMKLFGEAKFGMVIGDGGSFNYIPINFGASFSF
jgi:hypothetical protein